jgi:orotate phosphoribosyltransferase
VLVDDVVTSGATLTEAAATLQPTDVPVLAAVVAATPRRARRALRPTGGGGVPAGG